MAEVKKVIIAELRKNDNWYNIKGSDGLEYGVSKSKNPKLIALLDTIQVGGEIVGNLSSKDGKNYLWDPGDQKSGGTGGGRSFAPKDKSFDAAIAAAAAAGSMLFSKAPEPAAFDALFNHIHARIMEKQTKTTT